MDQPNHPLSGPNGAAGPPPPSQNGGRNPMDVNPPEASAITQPPKQPEAFSSFDPEIRRAYQLQQQAMDQQQQSAPQPKLPPSSGGGLTNNFRSAKKDSPTTTSTTTTTTIAPPHPQPDGATFWARTKSNEKPPPLRAQVRPNGSFPVPTAAWMDEDHHFADEDTFAEAPAGSSFFQQQQQQRSRFEAKSFPPSQGASLEATSRPGQQQQQQQQQRLMGMPKAFEAAASKPAGNDNQGLPREQALLANMGGSIMRDSSIEQRPRGPPEPSRMASGDMTMQQQQQLSGAPIGWTGGNRPGEGPTNDGHGARNEPPSAPKQPTMQPSHHMQQSAARPSYEGTVGYGGPLSSTQSPHAQQQPASRPGYGEMSQHEGGFGMQQQQQHNGPPPSQQDRGPPNAHSHMHGGQPQQQQQQHSHGPPQHHHQIHQQQEQQQRNSPGPYGGNNMDQQQQKAPPPGAALFMNPMGNLQGGPPGGMRELRVEDALLYLDDVKREFKDRPAIYNEFLAIMKNFKSQEVDTPGVIARVSKLFRGYNNLILGFNTFLPDGYKISLADLERAERVRVAEEQAAAIKAQGFPKGKKPKGQGKRVPKTGPPTGKLQQGGIRPVSQPPGYMTARPMNQRGSPGPEAASPVQQQPQQQQGGGQWVRSTEGQSTHGMSAPNQKQQQHQQQKQPGQPPRGPFNQAIQQPPPQQHQAVEFDHAISYVTTIKKRFASDPNTYHSFLEILHTYQKEQRGIKEVLEQVAHLFQDHPDLLKEFTFFLPDAVQEQAKERLHRAAAESESRIAAQRQQQMDRYNQSIGGGSAAQQQFIDMTRSQMGLPEADPRGRKRLADGQPMPTVQHQPESYVYNSAVERQFFDSAREALTSYSRDSGQAWAEFLKCLDMYAQEILSRSEMLNFVEPLLGKRNNNLFEEFKRILTAAGSPSLSTQLMEDSWYSVPLAEIDFGRCRRCSPSYRALPRDYPAHPCSERSEEEAKVLNDVWVSLPVGSEESYTFRHMRRNTYEETLFRVEDERFEIDMVIDSNDATLQRLEPIAEEIALLAQEDIIPADLGIKPQAEGAGLGGKRFQYTFDKKILGVIHRNAIARIYGDNGQEMVELLVRNPTVAVPLVVQRLRQKGKEWRVVRLRLNRQWKELAEHNYYKSLDHRSLVWRTTDKRAISTRTLIAEIKDRAVNGGRESKDAYRQKLDKAKEEHGTFFEVTVGEKLSQELDLTFLPKPDRRLFTPHLTLVYKNVSWAQRDAYRILAFALERGPISPADKERCHRLWVEFLGPWFDLSFNWMQKPAVTYQESSTSSTRTVRAPPATVVSEDDEESLDEDPELVSHMVTEELQTDTKDKEFTDHHPLPAGAHVSTLYGEGKIVEFRRSDHIYAVRLGFGAIGYLRPATVLCSMLPVEKSAYTRQLRAEDRTKLARPNDQLAFGTQSLYLFFRLHEILIQRLNTAKRLAYSVGDDPTLQSMVEQMSNVNPKAVGRRRYEAYLSLVYALLDGGVGGAAEGGKYEDRVRSLLGHGAYELATMDKLISHIWKDIQTMANDETMWSLVQLYRRHMLAGSFQPEAFRQEAAYLSDGEPMYAFQHCPLSSSDESVLHVEFLGILDDEDDDSNNMEEEIEPVVEQNANKRPKR